MRTVWQLTNNDVLNHLQILVILIASDFLKDVVETSKFF